MEKKPFHETVAAKLIEQLQEGTAPWQRPWEAGNPASYLPSNPTTGKRYKGINAVYLMAQGRSDQRWMTYKQAEAAGAQVRKGERGTSIQYWKFQEDQQVTNDRGERETQSVKLERPRVFFATVFNAEQIDGLPPLERSPDLGPGWNPETRVEAILAASQATIVHAPQDQAFYMPRADRIQLPEKSQFGTAARYYATALHELGHWTGHESRLNRDLSHPFGSAGYAKEELRAEIASMVLGGELGIGHDTQQHAAYVGSWIKVLQDDPLEIFRASADAEKILDYVMGLEQKHIQETAVQHKLVDELEQSKQLILNDEAHLVPRDHFVLLATPVALQGEEQQWEIMVGEKSFGLADAEDAFEAVFEAHRRQVNIALFSHAVPSGISPVAHLPSEEVMLDYPDLAEVYTDVLVRARSATLLVPKPFEDRPGYQMVFNAEPGNAGAVVINPEGGRLMLENLEAIQRYSATNQISLSDNRSLLDLNAHAERFRTVPEQLRFQDRYISTEGVPGRLYDRLANVAMSFNDAVLAASLRDLKTGTEATLEGDAQAFEEQSVRTFGFKIPANWSGRVNVHGYVASPGEGAHLVEQEGIQQPDFYGVSAVDVDGKAVPLQDLPTVESAEALANRMRMIDAHAEPDQLLHQAKLTSLLEEAIESYPETAEDQILNSRAHSGVLNQDALAKQEALVSDELITRNEVRAAPANLSNEDQAVASALQKLRTGKDARSLTNREELQKVSEAVLNFSLPPDWTGQVEAKGFSRALNDDWRAPPAAHELQPDAFQLFARMGDAKFGEDAFKYLTTVDAGEDLTKMMERLELIDAFGQPSELERAEKLARIQEQQMRRDPAATDAQRDAAKDAYKTAAAQVGREAGSVEARAGGTFIAVPYSEKAEAKALGAKWVRHAQSWFVPEGLNLDLFKKWTATTPERGAEPLNGPSKSVMPPAQTPPANAREFLAVPFEEISAAKSAGARWDTTFKSWYIGPNADIEALQRWKPENVKAEQDPAMSPREEFAMEMRELGLIPEGDHPIMDGNKHRVPVEGGKKGAVDGFYVLFGDGHPAGRIINNLTGADTKWKSKGYTLSPEQKATLQAEAAEKQANRAAKQLAEHNEKAAILAARLEKLTAVVQLTPYLARKGISAHHGAFTDDDNKTTYIPAIDTANKVWTMQYIQEDGTKRFAKNSRKEGCFHAVGGLAELAKAPALVIGEGYATAATLAEVLGFATVAAFDSGNLAAVATALNAKFPDKPIIVAGDNDEHQVMTLGKNPGRTKAEEAAAAVGGVALFPIFGSREQYYPAQLDRITPELVAADALSDAQKHALSHMKQFTDWNDLATRSVLGREGVERQLRPVLQTVIEKKTHELTLQRARSHPQGRDLRPPQEEVARPRRAARI